MGVVMNDRRRIAPLLGACAAAALLAVAAPPVRAEDGRGAEVPFRIGIVAEPGAGSTVAGLGLLKDAYAKALGMPVEFLVARDYGALVEAQAAGRLHYAVYSALAYAAASERCGCVEPVAAPVGADGAIGIRSVLIAREDGMADLSEIASHRIAAGPADSVTGLLLPLAGLAAEPARLRADAPYLLHAESAAVAEAMFADGRADALFGWEPASPAGEADPAGGTLARLEAAGIAPSGLRVVWRSPVLRFGPHAVLASLDLETKRRLGVFLTHLKAQSPEVYELLEPRHGGGLIGVAAQEYEAARSVVAVTAAGDP